ncbi:MAG: hypothetical protein ACFB4J_13620 [Elainellaceae cyanobacterium]
MQSNIHPGEPTPRHSSRSPIITISKLNSAYPADNLLNALNTPEPAGAIAPGPEDPDSLLHILIGPLYAVNNCRHELHIRGYAEPNDWSIPLKLLHTADVLRGQHPNDIMRVLRRRVQPRQQPN